MTRIHTPQPGRENDPVRRAAGCIVAHERVLRAAGMAPEQIQAAVRIAAVVHAVAATLEAEEATSGAPLAAG